MEGNYLPWAYYYRVPVCIILLAISACRDLLVPPPPRHHHHPPTHSKSLRYFQELRKQKFKYYEVVYPGCYDKSHPWGEDPSLEWHYYEYPNGVRESDGFTRIPIYDLCHVTHDLEADQICSNLSQGYYTFRPAKKLGKQYGDDSLPLGETYRFDKAQNRYNELPHRPHLPVFPGYLSWWGVSVKDWYEGAHHDCKAHDFVSNVEALGRQNVYVSGFLNPNPESSYGNNIFKASIHSLLHSYKESRIRSERSAALKQITFRVGGTLRYKHEICYVVIVCMEQDKDKFEPLYPSIWGQNVFEDNGMISQDGNVQDFSKIPEFKAQYIVNCIRDGGRYNNFSWENIAFAFYFPSGDNEFRCSVDLVMKGNIRHSHCISRRRSPSSGKMLCPNDFYEEVGEPI